MDQPMKDKLTQAHQDAVDGFTGWTWDHDPGTCSCALEDEMQQITCWNAEIGADLDGMEQALAEAYRETGHTSRCARQLAATERRYAEFALDCVVAAREHGAEALRHAERGEWDWACSEARQAAQAELETGEDAAWGPFYKAVEAAAEAAKAA